MLLPTPSMDIALNSTAGVALLRDATHATPYHQLSIHFETQRNQAFCSAATAVIMLNALSGSGGGGSGEGGGGSGSGGDGGGGGGGSASSAGGAGGAGGVGVGLGVASPVDGMYAPYAYFTQRALFENLCVNAVVTHQGAGVTMSAKFLATHGATLREWADYLACFVGSSGVTRTHAATADADAFRRDVVAAFTPVAAAGAGSAAASTTPTAYVGINFHRTEIGELGGGHMSPIGAYDAATDKVLVMDVSRYKYPPVWTPLASAYGAMNTTDGASGISRGWVVITGGGAAAGAGAAGASADSVPNFFSDEAGGRPSVHNSFVFICVRSTWMIYTWYVHVVFITVRHWWCAG